MGFLNLPTRRSFGRTKKAATACAQAAVPRAVLCGRTLALHRVLVTLLTAAKWRIPSQERDKSPAAGEMGFLPSKEELPPLVRGRRAAAGPGLGAPFRKGVSAELERAFSARWRSRSAVAGRIP